MKVLIIEDEALAAQRLKKLLLEIDPGIQITGTIDSIEQAVEWLEESPHPDLIFMDIMLADGQSFEIFERTEVRAPVIFTTAYDEFAIRAFKVNSIDYLLKPIEADLLSGALKKHASITAMPSNLKQALETLIANGLKNPESNLVYKKRFLVKTGDKFIPVGIADVAYFSFVDKLTFLTTTAQKRYMLDHTLDELEDIIDPHLFFRLNRQYIAAVGSIKLVHNYFNGKLKVMVSPEIPEGIIVSKERAQSFKTWLNR